MSRPLARVPANAPPLVLLHPLGSTGALSWSPLAESLRRAGYRVVAPDLPGHGSASDTAFTWESAWATVCAAAERFEQEKPVLVGHSLGAATAIYAAQRKPSSFAGLILSGAGACWKDRYLQTGLTVAAAVGALSAAVGRRELLAHAAGIRGPDILTAARTARIAPTQLWQAAMQLKQFDVRNMPPPPYQAPSSCSPATGGCHPGCSGGSSDIWAARTSTSPQTMMRRSGAPTGSSTAYRPR